MTRKHLLFTLALLCSQVSFAQFIGFETEIPKEFTTADKGKIALSIKQTQPAPEKKEFRPKRDFRQKHEFRQHNGFDSRRSSGSLSFEDRLSKFLKESDERLMDLKRNTESKRGGRGARHAD